MVENMKGGFLMDKESLSTYGWIIITIIILALMLLFATPFGSWCVDSMQQIPTKLSNAFGFTSVETPGGTATGGITIVPTPDDGGTTVHTCNYSVLVSSTPATCKATGNAVYKCNTCDNTQTQTLAIDPSNHAGETSITYVGNLKLSDTQEMYYAIEIGSPLDEVNDLVFHKAITHCNDCGEEVSSQFEERGIENGTLEWIDENNHGILIEYIYGDEDDPDNLIYIGYVVYNEEAHVDSDIPEYTDGDGVVHYLCRICQLGEDPGNCDHDWNITGYTPNGLSNGKYTHICSYECTECSATKNEVGNCTIANEGLWCPYCGQSLEDDTGNTGDECLNANIHNTYNYDVAIEISVNSYVSRGGTLPTNYYNNPENWHFFMCSGCGELWFLGDI